jgi:hypothetical protein
MDDKKKDNVVQFPKMFNGLQAPLIVDMDALKLQEDLKFADDMVEGLMVSMIHNMEQNDVDIRNERFIADLSFLSETIKAILYRDMGFQHPMISMMDTLCQLSLDKEDNKWYTDIDLKQISELFNNEEKDIS